MTALGVAILSFLVFSIVGFCLTAFVFGGLRYHRSDDPYANRFDDEWLRLKALHDGEARDI